MKKINLAIVMICTALSIMAFSKFTDVSEGAIGDVKYSVLPPDKFREENGNGWFLMDDKVPIKGSTLHTRHGLVEIPDSRGMFIRTLNGRRNDQYMDKFSLENNRERLVLDYQADAVKKHNHGFSTTFGFFCGWPSNNLWTGGRNGNPMVAGSPECAISTLDTGTNLSLEETRPKNISLYTYIKIN